MIINNPEFRKKHGLHEFGDPNIVQIARNDLEMFLDGSLTYLDIGNSTWLADALEEAGYNRLALIMEEIKRRLA